MVLKPNSYLHPDKIITGKLRWGVSLDLSNTLMKLDSTGSFHFARSYYTHGNGQIFALHDYCTFLSLLPTKHKVVFGDKFK